MKKTIPLALLAVAVSSALSMAQAQEAQAPAPAPTPSVPAEIPKTKGAFLIVALVDKPLTVQMSSAKTCEDERARLLAQALTSYCVWVR